MSSKSEKLLRVQLSQAQARILDLETYQRITYPQIGVINMAKGWAKELERHMQDNKKSFKEIKGDLTPGEVRLYQAVLRLRDKKAG